MAGCFKLKKIIVFAPHPDDEILACGGTIAKKVSENNELHVVYMTDGRHSHSIVLGIQSNPTPEELCAIREKEAANATMHLGVNSSNLFFLQFEDGYLDRNIQNSIIKVKDLIEKIKPDEIYFPDELDEHTDHQSLNTIVKTSLSELEINPKQYRYIIWSTQVSKTEKLKNQIQIDVSKFFNQKKHALNEYKSQISRISRRQRKPILSKKFLKKFKTTTETFFV